MSHSCLNVNDFAPVCVNALQRKKRRKERGGGVGGREGGGFPLQKAQIGESEKCKEGILFSYP